MSVCFLAEIAANNDVHVEAGVVWYPQNRTLSHSRQIHIEYAGIPIHLHHATLRITEKHNSPGRKQPHGL